jgi:hypothetical protein
MKQISGKELLSNFDESTHKYLKDAAGQDGATAVVMYEATVLNAHGDYARTAIVVGDSEKLSYKSVEDCEKRGDITDANQTRLVPSAWSLASEVAEPQGDSMPQSFLGSESLAQ